MAIARITEFMEALRNIENKGEVSIKKLCESELEYLRNTLNISYNYDKDSGLPISVNGSVTGLHSQLTEYRNAVKTLELNSKNSHTYIKGRRYVTEHLALKYLVKAPIEKLVRGENQTTQKYKKHTDIKRIDSESIILKAEEMIDQSKAKRPSYIKIALGLMLLTGRRPGEILKTANFKEVSDYEVLFSGQLKTKGSENAQTKPYVIPTLVSADKIVKALQHLRELRDFSELTTDEVHSKTNKTLNESVKTNFLDLIPGVTPHKLRSVYAAICDYTYRSETNLSRDAYVASILGHSAEDVATAQSYVGYEVL